MPDSFSQPENLVVVEDEAGKEYRGILQRGGNGIGVSGNVAIAKYPNLQLRRARRGGLGSLAVQVGIKGFKPGNQYDPLHRFTLQTSSSILAGCGVWGVGCGE